MMDSISFWLSKVLWAVFSPAHFVVILLVLSFFIIKNRLLKLIIQGFAGVFFAVALMFPIGDWALLPLEQCNAEQGMPMNVDGVLVLGGAVNITISDARNSISLNDSAERIFALLKLLKQYPDAQFVYAGGSSSLKKTSKGEADYVRQFLDDMGVRPASMVFEAVSRNTYEDAMETKEIYTKTPKQSWLLVTSAFHMPRSFGIFEKMSEASGTMFYPYVVDYKTSGKFKLEMRFDLLQTLLKLDTAAHEYVGLLFNSLLKRSNSFMPCAAQTKTLQ
jgi:uncharacterized SAM-binding protein YcdF (DUF218 family)